MLFCEQSELTFQTGLIYFVSLNWLQKVNKLQASLACEHAGFLNLIAVNWKNKKFSKCCSKFTSIKSFKIAKFKTMYKVTSLHRNVSIGKLNRIIHLHDSALEIRSDWKLIIRIKIYGSVYKRFYRQSLQVLSTLTLWVHWHFFQVPSWLWFFFRAQVLKVFFSFFLVTSYWSKCLMFFRSSFSFDVYQMEGKGLSPCYLFHESGVLHHFFQKVRCSLGDNKKAPLVQMYHIFFALIKTILKKFFLFVFIFNRYKFCCADLPSAIVVHGRKVCFLVKLKIQMLSCEQSQLTFHAGLIYFVSLNRFKKANILQVTLACEHAKFSN